LRRWKISENVLPEGSIVQFREPTLWQRYKWYVPFQRFDFFSGSTADLVFVWSISSSAGERNSLWVESREALSDMSQRLIEAQEKERTWIALVLHDDINQRLAALKLRLSLVGRRDFRWIPGKRNSQRRTEISRG
jgi:signal transduction histidine kinase